MTEIRLDSKTFDRRIRALLALWKDHRHVKDHVFFEVSSLLVLQGSLDEDNPYSKTSSLHNWLLGYEFPDMLMLLTQEMVYFLTSDKKATILEMLREDLQCFPITVFRRSKQPTESAEVLKKIVSVMENAGKRVGILAKDVFKGKFSDEWRSVYRSEAFEEVDVSMGIAMVMAVKEDDELKCIRMACKASVVLISTYFVDKMSTIIDEEEKMPHSRLAEMVERKLEDDTFLLSKEMKISPDFDPEQLEWCYTPIIQSGGNYDLRPSAVSDDNLLQGDVILCSLGLRYKSYCSNIGRTYMIDPNKSQENYYDFLLLLQKKVFESIKDGAVIKDVYNKALGLIRMKYPELESKFVRNIGFGIGIEFQDRNLMLNSKNNRVLKDGMTLNVSIGFNGIENPKPQHPRNRTYSLLLIDTVRVTKDTPIVYTDNLKSYNDISYYNDDEPSGKETISKKKPERKASAVNSAILKRKTRGENKDVDDSAEQRRKQHQKELAQKKQEEGLSRFSNGNGIQNGIEKPVLKKFESYKRDSQMPSSINNLKIVVDTKNSSIIVPIYGRPVPFHILTLKNVSKNDEGEYVYLRLNFLTPGQGVGKKDDMPFDDLTASFIRSLTFRSSDTRHMSEIFTSIQEMKKNVAKREAERKEMADVIEQDNLIEIKNRRPLKLIDVFVRPALDGKRVPGELEIHQNGLRYQSPLRSDHKIDLLFSNIKHLFFQPCDHELIALIHVHLKNSIMVGKKRAKDIQFYREASDMQFDETGNRKRKYRYGDEDELELEQEERRRRTALNREFKAFSEKISESNEGQTDVDIPVRELGFTGVPFRSNVLLQPTTECLVHLTDPPFLVITLSDIEIAHLERVQFGLKNFDLVFVFKDFRRPPAHINTIPMSHLDNVKDCSVDIAYTEGVLNLNWITIMKTINDDPLAFFEEGGWAFLNNESDDESAESEEEGSEFTASEDQESEEESEYDEDASEEESDFEEENVSDVEDWDELEKKASRDDTKRSRNNLLHDSTVVLEGLDGLPQRTAKKSDIERNRSEIQGYIIDSPSKKDKSFVYELNWTLNSTAPLAKQYVVSWYVSPLVSLEGVPLNLQEVYIMDDLLSLLMGVEGRFIQYQSDDDRWDENSRLTGVKFKISSGIDPSLLDLTKIILKNATSYITIDTFIEIYSKPECGLVNHALCAVLRKLLKGYFTLIAQLEHQFNTNSSFTIHTFHLHMHATSQSLFQMQALIHDILKKGHILEEENSDDTIEDVELFLQSIQDKGINNIVGSGICKGGTVLEVITSRLLSLSGDPHAKKLLEYLLKEASKPYMKMLNAWLHRGEICDPHSEFMIKEQKSIKKDSLDDDYIDEYWEKRYTIRDNEVPSQLEPVKTKVLIAGKYLNVVRECGGIDISKEIGDNIPSAFDDIGFLDNINVAYAHADAFLLELLLATHDLSSRLQSLKHYFFLDRSDFFTHFLDLASHELKKPVKDISLTKLQSLLEISIRIPGSIAANDPFKEDIKIQMSNIALVDWLMKIVSMSGIDEDAIASGTVWIDDHQSQLSCLEKKDKDFIGFNGLQFDYTVPFPLSLVISRKAVLRYQLIFRHILSLKYLEQLLGLAWLDHSKNMFWKKYSTFEKVENWKNRVWVLRSKMLNFVQQLFYYCTNEVMEPNWLIFQLRLSKISTVDQLMQDHIDFLDACLKECMLTNSKLLRVQAKLMTTCTMFASNIKYLTRSLASIEDDSSNTSQIDHAKMKKLYDILHKYEENFSHHLKILLDTCNYFARTETVSLLSLVDIYYLDILMIMGVLIHLSYILLVLLITGCCLQERSLTGTWTSKSRSVFTGPEFYDPVRDMMFPPKLTGISYSFTDDGFFEESLYRVRSNPTTPECSISVMQWQHGTFQILDNGSLLLIPIPSDGRQIFSDPCLSETSRYTRFNVKELMSKYEITLDPYYNEYKLQLYQFDGAPVQPLYLAYFPPQMLPTTTLNPIFRKNYKRSLESPIPSSVYPDYNYVLWIGSSWTLNSAATFQMLQPQSSSPKFLDTSQSSSSTAVALQTMSSGSLAGQASSLDPSDFPALGASSNGSLAYSSNQYPEYAFSSVNDHQKPQTLLPRPLLKTNTNGFSNNQDDFSSIASGIDVMKLGQPNSANIDNSYTDAYSSILSPILKQQNTSQTVLSPNRSSLLSIMTGNSGLLQKTRKSPARSNIVSSNAIKDNFISILKPGNTSKMNLESSFAERYSSTNSTANILLSSFPSSDTSSNTPFVDLKESSTGQAFVTLTPVEKFSLKGLLSIFRMENPNSNILALGSDLTTLGLNLNQPDDRPLYMSFLSPWMDSNATKGWSEPKFHLPACYNVQLAPPPLSKIRNFSDETLFYIFYSMPRDAMQEAAAQELTNRNWRYHKELKLWLTKEPGVEPIQRTPQYERGQYIFFDYMLWEKLKKEFLLIYDALEDRFTPFTSNISGEMGLGSRILNGAIITKKRFRKHESFGNSKNNFELLQLESIFPDADPLYLAECLAYYEEDAVQRSTLKIIFHCYEQYPKKGSWLHYAREDEKKNAKLDILNQIFPNIDTEFLRNELIRKEDTYLLKCVESLLNMDIESSGASRLVIGRIEPWQRFRSHEYISSVKIQLISEFPDVPSSAIKAVMAENNNDYYRSKIALSRIRSERCWKSLNFFVKKISSKANHVMCEELAQEIFNLEKNQRDELVKKDFELAVQLNWKENYENGILIECGCCFFEYAWETLAYCSEGHIVCRKCLERCVQEGVYGQGNLRGKPQIKCISSHFETLCTGFYSKEILEISLPPDLLKAYEDSKIFGCIRNISDGSFIACPFCGNSSTFLRERIDKVAYRILRKKSGSLFKCKNIEHCGKYSCNQCGKEWLPLHKCFEKELDGLRLYVEREMANAVKRTCPVCNLSFVKSDGCNKLVCQCGYVICYICRKNIKKESYAHFCGHFRSIPGKKCTECTKCDLYKVDDNIAAVAERATKEYLLQFEKSKYMNSMYFAGQLKEGSLFQRMSDIIENMLELLLERILVDN
ncbi:hypothetical protein PCANB_001423 [Pneumocystis canis]|nr:hypothetical protein PCANB_001423 [Pneumocystis canis]